MIFSLFSPVNRLWHIMQIISLQKKYHLFVVCWFFFPTYWALIPSGHMTFIQRRFNVDATSWRCIDVEATLYLRYMPAGFDSTHIKSIFNVRNQCQFTYSPMKIRIIFYSKDWKESDWNNFKPYFRRRNEKIWIKCKVQFSKERKEIWAKRQAYVQGKQEMIWMKCQAYF